MKYVVRTESGEEVGPIDHDVILQWVKRGKISGRTEVRNSLMKTWTTAEKMPFYDEYLKGLSTETRIMETKTAEDFDGPKEAVYSLNQAGFSKFVPAGPIIRACAWIMDTLFTAGISMSLIYVLMMNVDNLSDDVLQVAFILIAVGSVFWYALYYTLGLGFKAQTFGQWFWGIMIVRPDGSPVFPARAFIYAMLYPFVAISSPVFYLIMPGRRTLQELLSGTRIIRIKRSK